MDITPIVEALILLVVAFIGCFVIPFVRSKTSVSQRQELQAWITLAVQAAEQLYQGQGRGAEKKAYVIKWLEDHGIYIDESQLEVMLESAVYALKAQVMS